MLPHLWSSVKSSLIKVIQIVLAIRASRFYRFSLVNRFKISWVIKTGSGLKNRKPKTGRDITRQSQNGHKLTNRNAYHKYKGSFPDIDIRYRHDQDMSGERPEPYTWDRSAGGEPYPLSARREALRRERRIHEEKMRRENEENWKRRFREMRE